MFGIMVSVEILVSMLLIIVVLMQSSKGGGLAGVFFEGGLGIEGIDVRGAAVHEQVNDAFGFGGEVRLFRGERGGITGFAPSAGADPAFHQGAETEGA